MWPSLFSAVGAVGWVQRWDSACSGAAKPFRFFFVFMLFEAFGLRLFPCPACSKAETPPKKKNVTAALLHVSFHYQEPKKVIQKEEKCLFTLLYFSLRFSEGRGYVRRLPSFNLVTMEWRHRIRHEPLFFVNCFPFEKYKGAQMHMLTKSKRQRRAAA